MMVVVVVEEENVDQGLFYSRGPEVLLVNCVLCAFQSSFSWQQLKHAKFSEIKYIRLLKAEFSFVPQIRRPLHCMKRNGRCEFY